MPIDATQRPLKIPPQYQVYAEQNNVFDLLQRMTEALVVDLPTDPLKYMTEWLKIDSVRKIHAAIIGPPGSGKRMLATHVNRKTGAIRIDQAEILSDKNDPDVAKIKQLIEDGKTVDINAWTKPIINRLRQSDCRRRGWILEGFPRTRLQAVELQRVGFQPDYLIVLDGPDSVLKARHHGKKLDPVTGEYYHPLFNWTDDEEVLARLEKPTLTDSIDDTEVFRSHKQALIQIHKHNCREINADQPLSDIKAKVISYIGQPNRSKGKRTARVVIMGPRGSGKATLSMRLASKYNFMAINVKQLVQREKLTDSNIARRIKGYEKDGEDIPNDIILKLIDMRLREDDCISNGWVLYGITGPNSVELLSSLVNSPQSPNRILFLDMPSESTIERICYRSTDPVTGTRYHQLYDPPPSTNIALRLLQRPEDTEEFVKNQLDQYNAQLSDLLDVSAEVQPLRINADQDGFTVFELAESKIVNPLPSPFYANNDDE